MERAQPVDRACIASCILFPSFLLFPLFLLFFLLFFVVFTRRAVMSCCSCARFSKQKLFHETGGKIRQGNGVSFTSSQLLLNWLCNP